MESRSQNEPAIAGDERRIENQPTTSNAESPEVVEWVEMDETSCLQELERLGTVSDYVAPQGGFLQKWNEAAPYHMFLNKVPAIPETQTHPLSVTFSEILDRSIGDIVQSLHTTMVVDLQWMWNQYIVAGQDKKINITVFYGIEQEIPFSCDNIKAHKVECQYRFGSHHAKISIFQYQDKAIRIVVSSSNLFRDDWEFRTQGLWMSPHLSRMHDSAEVTDGESPTEFKADFLRFLRAYGSRMDDWIDIVSRADCSAINVAFVASVPGYHDINNTEWGHQKLGKLLHEHMVIPVNEPRMSIVGQASSIGSLGANYQEWIGDQLIVAMTKPDEEETKKPTFSLIFPTMDEYRNSLDQSELSNSLFNEGKPAQNWITEYLRKWKADHLSRARTMPHIKTWTRLSADNKRISFFVLGSANLSKAAWGKRLVKKYQILSYEANVVFIPKFVTGEKDFPVCEDPTRSSPIFPIPYDLPVIPCSPTDEPFVNGR